MESTWLVSRRRLPQDGRPIAYLDVHDGKLHPYTAESERDTYLQHLFIRYSDTLFKPSRIPLDVYKRQAIDSLTIITVGDRLVCNVGRIIVED